MKNELLPLRSAFISSASSGHPVHGRRQVDAERDDDQRPGGRRAAGRRERRPLHPADRRQCVRAGVAAGRCAAGADADHAAHHDARRQAGGPPADGADPGGEPRVGVAGEQHRAVAQVPHIADTDTDFWAGGHGADSGL